jgi:hypothetical protein
MILTFDKQPSLWMKTAFVPAHDHLRYIEGCNLDDGSNAHDGRAQKHTFLPPKRIAYCAD